MAVELEILEKERRDPTPFNYPIMEENKDDDQKFNPLPKEQV
jgi:hypothetical protein